MQSQQVRRYIERAKLCRELGNGRDETAAQVEAAFNDIVRLTAEIKETVARTARESDSSGSCA